MNETINKLVTWIKSNLVLTVIIIIGISFLFFGSKIKRLFTGRRRVRHSKAFRDKHVSKTGNRRTLPRSVGMRAIGRGYPAAGGGYIPFKKNADGTIKKAWQVAGTLAAKNRMKRLRKARA